MIDIRDIAGKLLLSTPINVGSKRRYTLMKEDYILLKFSLASPISFWIGSKVDDPEIGLFEVTDTQKPKYNTRTGGYDYDLRLDNHYWKWKNKIFKYTPEYPGNEATWNLTASLEVHLSVFIRNLDALGYKYRGHNYSFVVDSTVATEAKLVSYDNTNMLDALTKMAEAWSCEWWVEDSVIHFGRCEYGTSVALSLDTNLVDMTAQESKNTYATRIYAFGSTRNLPPNYRQLEEQAVINGVVQKRLMLPPGVPYIDSNPGLRTEEAVEQVVIFDNVYPRTNGTISSIETYEGSVEGDDGNPVTETFYRFTDEGFKFSEDYLLPDIELRMVFQSGALNGMDFGVKFNPNAEDEKSSVDGSDNPAAQLFEIVVNEDYGRRLPDDVLTPAVGDRYVLYGWDSTKIAELGLVGTAESELKAEAEKYVKQTQIDPNTYTCKVMSDWIKAAGTTTEGKFLHPLTVGDRVKLCNDVFFKGGSRESRIIGIEYNLDIPYDTPIYTIGETTAYSRIGELEKSIESLTLAGQTFTGGFGSSVFIIGTNDATVPTNRNVYSALRSQKEFLSKTHDDATGHRLTAKSHRATDYTQTGMNFTEGWFGSGARCWRDPATGRTFFEVDVIRARETLETMKLRFNMVDVVSGELWQTFAYGTADRVEAGTGPTYRGGNGIAVGEGNCWIELLEDELLTFKHDDICRGIFHNIALDGSEKNNTSNDTDSCGFQQISGYTTAYFTPIALIDADGEIIEPMTDEAGNVMKDKNGIKLYDITRAKGFRYRLRQGSSFHPRKGMKIAAYGNFTDPDRQATTYATTKRLIMMEGVNTWRIDPDRNYTYIRGDLDGMEIGGMTLEGHGVMMNRAYLYGPMIKFTKEQREELQGQDAYSVHLTQETGVITLDADGNPHALMGRYLVTTADEQNDKYNVTVSGPKLVTAHAWILHTSLQVHKAGKQLTWIAEGAPAPGSYTATLGCKGCEAVIENGIIYVTAITDLTIEPGIDIMVACEGEVVIKRHYSIHLISSGDWTTYVFAHDVLDTVSKKYVAPGKPTCRIPYPWEANSVAELPADATAEQKAAAKADDTHNHQWIDGPEPYSSDGKLIYPIWYMSKAVIDGSTGKLKAATDWSEPVKATGEDGGDTDFMYARQDKAHAATAPGIMREQRNPNNGLPSAIWHDTPQPGEAGSSLWMTVARIRQDGTTDTYNDGIDDNAAKTGKLVGMWSEPVRITGEKGEQGDSAITLDLDNEYDSILMNADNKCVYDLILDSYGDPLADQYYPRTRVRLFDGADPIELASLTIVDVNDWRVDPNYSMSDDTVSEYYYLDETPGLRCDGVIHFRCNHLANPDYNPKNPGEDGGDPYGEISTYGAEGDLPMCMRVHVVATGYSRKSKKLCTGRAEWTLVRDNGSHIYRLIPEVSQIHVTTDGEFTDSKLDDGYLRCEVQRVGSDGAVILSTLPDDLLLEVSGITDGVEGDPVEVDYADGASLAGISDDDVTDYIFRLYDKNTLDDSGNNRLLDRETVPVLRDGGRGKRGLPGLRIRLWKEIAPGQTYRNDEGIEEEVETGYVDFLAVRGKNVDSGYYVYRVKPGVVYEATDPVPVNALLTSPSGLKGYLGNDIFEYWEEVDENVNTGFFNYLIANHALIDILSNTQLLIRTPQNEVVGGMQGCDRTKPVIWAGAENPEDAPVQIIAGADGNGKPFGYAIIEGRIIAGKKGGQRVELNPNSMAVEIYDADNNPCTTLSGRSVSVDSLPDGGSMGVAENTATCNVSGAMDGHVIWQAAPQNSGIITLNFDATLNAILRGEPPVGGSTQDLFELPYIIFEVAIHKVSGGIVNQETLILADNHIQENIEVSQTAERSISFRAEAGAVYSATLTVTVSSTATIKAGSKVVVSCETLANAYHAEFGRNGMILSLNKANSFAVVEESDGKLIHIRNGVKQPYTLMAAEFDIGSSVNDYDVEIFAGANMISNLRVESAGSMSFYIPDSMSAAPLIVNATSLLHGAFACVNRDGSYIQVKLIKGSTMTAGRVYVEIKAF